MNSLRSDDDAVECIIDLPRFVIGHSITKGIVEKHADKEKYQTCEDHVLKRKLASFHVDEEESKIIKVYASLGSAPEEQKRVGS